MTPLARRPAATATGCLLPAARGDRAASHRSRRGHATKSLQCGPSAAGAWRPILGDIRAALAAVSARALQKLRGAAADAPARQAPPGPAGALGGWGRGAPPAAGARRRGARTPVKIALFLGAGASVPYGMPTAADLWDRIRRDGWDLPRRDLLASGRFPGIEHALLALDQLFDFLRSRAGELYAEFVRSVPGGGGRGREGAPSAAKMLDSHVSDSRKSRDAIGQIIAHYYKWDPTNNAIAENILGPLFDLARSRDGHVTVFTTNYDAVIEEYCGRPGSGIECDDGVDFDDKGRAVARGGGLVPRNHSFSTKVILYKLHGSMNWPPGALSGRMSSPQGLGAGAPGARARGMCIRPSPGAGAEAAHGEPYATILRRFRRALPSFDVCIAIGYSFRDPYVSRQLVKFAGSRKILIVLSPTAASDFERNALKEGPPGVENDGWRGSSAVQAMTLGYNGMTGAVYAISAELDAYMAGDIVDAIKSIISGTYRATERAAGARVI